MHAVTFPDQDKAFFALLEQHPELDGRDPRGTKHSLALVLMGVIMALCAGPDGNLSSMHRHMKNQFDALCHRLGYQAQRVVSRAQLPRLLAQTNQPVLAQLVQAHYGFQLTDKFTDWLSGDGKELRGLRGAAQLPKASSAVKSAFPSSLRLTKPLWHRPTTTAPKRVSDLPLLIY